MTNTIQEFMSNYFISFMINFYLLNKFGLVFNKIEFILLDLDPLADPFMKNLSTIFQIGSAVCTELYYFRLWRNFVATMSADPKNNQIFS